MAEYTFFTHPRSRGQIARWALHEAGAEYEQVLIDWRARDPGLLAINAMGKVPTIVHHTLSGNQVVSETAAICAYLAEAHPLAELGPAEIERGDYYRWLFFAAGPLEQAIMARHLKLEPTPEQEVMAGWGSYDRTVDTLAGHLENRHYVCGERFTMSDVYVGSQVDFGLILGSLPPRPEFVAYADRLRTRTAYIAAKAIDHALIGKPNT